MTKLKSLIAWEDSFNKFYGPILNQFQYYTIQNERIISNGNADSQNLDTNSIRFVFPNNKVKNQDYTSKMKIPYTAVMIPTQFNGCFLKPTVLNNQL